MSKMMKATMFRNHFADALDEVKTREKFLLITRNEEIVSALVDIDFFEELLAKTSKEYLKSIREARRQYKKGGVYSHIEVFGKL